MRGELKEKNVLIGSLQKAAETGIHGRKRQEKRLIEVTKFPWYDIWVQKCFYGLKRVVDDWLLQYTKLETAQVCYDCRGVGGSWMNRIGMVTESREGTMFVAREKGMVPRCPLQLGFARRPYTPSPEQESDDFLKHEV